MRIGLVCPYDWDVPGGVQSHVRDLARVLRARGHEASVLAPGEARLSGPGVASSEHAPQLQLVGRAVPVPYNGSVARVAFGPRVAARVRAWVRGGKFDILHVHEPSTPSLSLLALWASEQPVVATFHTANERSLAMSATAAVMRPAFERIAARIAVSEAARNTLVSHIGGEPVIIPNGIDVASFAEASPRDEWRAAGRLVAFLGRLDEPRKGFPIAVDALARLRVTHPDARLVAAGPSDDAAAGADVDGVTMLGRITDAERAELLASADVLLAPNTGGESFGIVLVEAMAAGAAVVASDLPAFRRVLDDGRLGSLFAVGDPSGAAREVASLLDRDAERSAVVAAARAQAQRYDWTRLIGDIEAVYATVAGPSAA